MPIRLFSRLLRPTTTIIPSPRLALVNYKGAAAAGILEQDRAALGAMFSPAASPAASDVLFLYCDIEASGRLLGAPCGLRELIRDNPASIVVVASENPASHCIAASRPTGYGRANLVLTLDRRGPNFSEFFARLFGRMMSGTPMPVAWASIAPQIPGRDHPDCPETIFIAELGRIAFR